MKDYWQEIASQTTIKGCRVVGKRSVTRIKHYAIIQNVAFCWYCKCSLTFQTATLDHIIAKSKGGSSHFTNLVLCCYRCNQMKGNT